jgi:hypothetical protein
MCNKTEGTVMTVSKYKQFVFLFGLFLFGKVVSSQTDYISENIEWIPELTFMTWNFTTPFIWWFENLTAKLKTNS